MKAQRVLLSRSMRAVVDGAMAVLLPAYLLELGFGTFEVGVIATATMLGSAFATLAVGAFGHRLSRYPLLPAAGVLMALTGLGFAGLHAYAALLIFAFVGTLNPSSGDVSVFLPLEHARIAASATGHERTSLFARYSVLGAVCAAAGALAAGVPDWLVARFGLARITGLEAMFIVYAIVGAAVAMVYAGDRIDPASARVVPLGPSRGIVVKLATLFSVDSFAGGLVVNSLLALWLLQRFGLSLAQAGTFFFAAGLLSATSQFLAARLSRRIGLLNTMVFTHIPASMFLIGAAFAPTLPLALALLLCRSALSQMDVPARSAFVMAVVTPAERPAAASFTAVPRSLASAVSPTIAGAMFAAGWVATPLVACGVLKIAYDLVLWRACRGHPLDGSS